MKIRVFNPTYFVQYAPLKSINIEVHLCVSHKSSMLSTSMNDIYRELSGASQRLALAAWWENQPSKRKKTPRRDGGSSAARTTKSACTHC
jgi:hypothetical protein